MILAAAHDSFLHSAGHLGQCAQGHDGPMPVQVLAVDGDSGVLLVAADEPCGEEPPRAVCQRTERTRLRRSTGADGAPVLRAALEQIRVGAVADASGKIGYPRRAVNTVAC